jgi:hypothetical protein
MASGMSSVAYLVLKSDIFLLVCLLELHEPSENIVNIEYDLALPTRVSSAVTKRNDLANKTIQ